LLHEALRRARAVTSSLYTCAVVAQRHRRWWEQVLHTLPAANVIVQPENRGTANGILLPLLHIMERDPGAQIVLLPSDHHVLEEHVLARSLRHAIEQLQWRFDETILLGLKPEESDPELGYIIPGRGDGRGALEVRQFVEKPTAMQAHQLIEHGGLWNAFIVVSTAQALLTLFGQRMPQIVREMRVAVQRDLKAPFDGAAVAELYERLPNIDFSRDVLQGKEAQLRVLPVPQCGWSDLGTPKRVAEVLRRAPRNEFGSAARMEFGHLSLAAQHERMQMTTG
jgi:mannose-1-phosphate guanylyltransferase